MSKTENTTEIAQVTATAVDIPDAVVADVAQTIRDLHRTVGLQVMYDIGGLILTKFYGGDEAAFRSHGAKNSSLRRLAEQPDMPLGRSALHQAVEVHLVLARLGGPQALGSLGPSHVRTVLALPAPEQDKLLAKAEAKALTVKQLEDEARKAKERSKTGGGRPALPAFVKSIHALAKYVDGDLFGGLEAVDELEADVAQALHATVAGLKARCEELMGRLGGRVVERVAVDVEAVPEKPLGPEGTTTAERDSQARTESVGATDVVKGPLVSRLGPPPGALPNEPGRVARKGRSGPKKHGTAAGAASQTATASHDAASAMAAPNEVPTEMTAGRRSDAKTPKN